MNCELKLPAVAIFAATDGTGGAGLFADIAAVRNAGCRAVAITTAVTAQNLHTVSGLWSVSAACVQAQFDAVSNVAPRALRLALSPPMCALSPRVLMFFPKRRLCGTR